MPETTAGNDKKLINFDGKKGVRRLLGILDSYGKITDRVISGTLSINEAREEWRRLGDESEKILMEGGPEVEKILIKIGFPLHNFSMGVA